jgi:hypothetical protein
VQRAVVEIKLLRGTLEQTIEQGLEQTAAYMALVGTTEGHLAIFDRRPDADPATKVFHRRVGAISVWGM